MTSEALQIKDSYEINSMTPQEIATDRELDLIAVKATLMQCSPKYRRDCGTDATVEDALNFNDEDLRRVNEVILDIALASEDERLRFQAATYIRDDKKGRKDVAKNLGNVGFNIFNFNSALKASREQMKLVMGEVVSG